MKSIFQSEAARESMLAWHERFRARLVVPTESRTVPTRFGDTHVLVGGPAGAPPVVVVHGAMASSAHALVELAPLLARYRVHAVDTLGQSPKTPHARPSVATNDYGAWLAEVLDGLGLARAHVVAISWGGFAAIRLAVVAPERIDRLALLVPAGMVNGSAWQGFTKIGWPMLLWKLFRSDRRFEPIARALLTRTDDDWLPYLRDAFRAYRMDMRIPKLATPAELAGLRAPVLVIAAEEDVSFPGEKLLARARELFADVETELVAGSKHCPPTTDEFRRWLADRIAAHFDAAPATAVA